MTARILVADDDFGFRFPIVSLLEDHGFEVLEAANAPELISQAERADFWIIDVRLPSEEMEGIVAVTELVRRGVQRDLIFMSVLPEDMASGQLQEIRAASVKYEWLEKPLNLGKLLAVVEGYGQGAVPPPEKVDHPIANRSNAWVPTDTGGQIMELLQGLKPDEPLSDALRKIFCMLTSRMMFYSGCAHGLHLLANAMPSARRLHKFELHHLYIGPETAERLNGLKVEEYQVEGDDCIPDYVYMSEIDLRGETLLQSVQRGIEGLSGQSPDIGPGQIWNFIIKTLNSGRSGGDLIDWPENTKVLVIPLSKRRNEKLPLGRMGTLLLWDEHLQNLDFFLANRERWAGAAMVLGKSARHLLESQYGIEERTYLPSFKTAEPRKVAILFSDIRDFTPTAEIARNFNLLDEFLDFMRDYCKKMCELIQQEGGRVHNLAGDGIMAIFGEHVLEQEAVSSAVDAATKMCREFDIIKEGFLARRKIRDFLRDECEPIDLRLGIGINFGEVMFDYFGAEGSRIYSPLGDHVNFAQRLESEASRFDERLPRPSDGHPGRRQGHPGRLRAPILLSRPAWIRRGGSPSEPAHLHIQVKGKPYSYPAYEIWPLDPEELNQ